jgi:hypothetical protein
MVEVRVLAAAAIALASVADGDESAALDLINIATELGVWDPVVCALRTSRSLAALLAGQPHLHPLLQDIYARSTHRARHAKQRDCERPIHLAVDSQGARTPRP